MTDLVDRLRRLSGFLGHSDAAVLLEAAGEIEQLRTAAPALPSCAQPTEYRLSLLPEDHRDGEAWAVYVRWKGSGRWSVERLSLCLGADGWWDHARAGAYIEDPAERDAWFDAHRWDLPTALQIAERALPTIEVDGMTAADVLAASGPVSLTEGHRDTGAGQ